MVMSSFKQRIRFCTGPDGVRIAYATTGTGPPIVPNSPGGGGGGGGSCGLLGIEPVLIVGLLILFRKRV